MTRERLLVLLRIAVWVLVGACVLVFARRLDWNQVSHAFQGVDLGMALLATLVCVPCTSLQGLRWASLVRGIRRVPRSTPVAAIYVGQAASAFLRVIGQWVETNRDPSLFTSVVARRDGDFSGSALFAYKLNWQSVMFVGYGDERDILDNRDPPHDPETLEPASRTFFLKLSYAFQR